MKAEDFLPPTQPNDTPPMNRMIEDLLAYAATEEDRVLTLEVWLRLGSEYLAREAGRAHAREVLRGLDTFVRDARPTRPWKD